MTLPPQKLQDWHEKDATGRVSLGAVKTLLAKVHLTMAGQPKNKEAASYTLAAAKANEVIMSNNFSLFPNYNDLHNIARENRGEHIFQIQYLASVSGNPNLRKKEYNANKLTNYYCIINFQ